MEISQSNKDVASKICHELGILENNRSLLENLWDEIADYHWPGMANTFQLRGHDRQEGQKRTDFILDSAPSVSLRRGAAILNSLLTPAHVWWHRFEAGAPKIKNRRKVRLYFEEVLRRLFKYRGAPEAGFNSQNGQALLSVSGWGTGYICVLRPKDRIGLSYHAIPLSEGYIAQNHEGKVKIFYRRFRLEAHQAADQFGLKKLSDDIQKAVRDGDIYKKFEFIHCIRPRALVDSRRRDAGGYPFESCYIEKQSKTVVEMGGYRTFPIAVGRGDRGPGEIYGRGFGMDSLAPAKTLMDQKRTVLKAGHKAVDPAFVSYHDDVLDSLNIRAGAFNAGGMDAEGRMLVGALPSGDPKIGIELMELEKKDIKAAHQLDLLEIFVEDRTDMTATEVWERRWEKALVMAPWLGLLQEEMYGEGLIPRELDVLESQGVFDDLEIPQELVETGGEYETKFSSAFNRQQRSDEMAGVRKMLDLGANLSQFDPGAMDVLDVDKAMRLAAEGEAVPEDILRSEEDIAAIRESRAKAAAEEQEIRAAPGAAALTKAAAVAGGLAGGRAPKA